MSPRPAQSAAAKAADDTQQAPSLSYTAPGEKKDSTPLRPLTPEEQAIAARVAVDTRDEWDRPAVEWEGEYELMRDIFELPAPAKREYEAHRFAFRWIARDPRRLDEMRNKPVPLRWFVCNSTNTPFLAPHLDPVLGCVCREDQMLVFKPWWMRDAEWSIREKRADSYSGGVTSKDGEGEGRYGLEAHKRSIEDERKANRRIEVNSNDLLMSGDVEEYLEGQRGTVVGDAGDMDVSEV